MEIIGSFEAKTHWSALLEKVSLGQEIIITKRGKPIARLIPEIETSIDEIDDLFKQVKLHRKTANLHGYEWRKFRDEGRS